MKDIMFSQKVFPEKIEKKHTKPQFFLKFNQENVYSTIVCLAKSARAVLRFPFFNSVFKNL